MRAASVVVLIAIALPFLLGQFWAYQLGLYALYAAAAVGVGLCWGQAGFLPLGQALFFGLAAYLSGLAFIAFQDSPIVSVLTLPLAAIVSGLLAYLIGIVIFRRSGESGAYFSMITLALALLAFQVATSWNSVTGGFNGLKGIPGLPGLDDISDVYYVAASVLLALLAFGAWLYNAPIGVLWRALAQNERRAEAVRLRYRPAQGRGLRRERTDGRHRRRDLRTATGHRHPAGDRLRSVGRSRDLGCRRRPRELARAGDRHTRGRLAHRAIARHACRSGKC